MIHVPRVGALLVGALVLTGGVGHAQGRPKAAVTPIVERDSVMDRQMNDRHGA